MAKLRLVGWTVLTGVTAVVLLRGMTWPADDPAVAVMAVIRGVAGVLAAYLFVVTVLAVRLPRLAPRFVARLVAGAVGTGLLVAPLAAAADPRPRPPAEAPVLRRVPDERSRDLSAPDVVHSGPENESVVVAPGEHLWSIAERAVAERLGRAPTDDEVAPYWREVVDLNHQLADPDLVFPGTEIRLPS